MSDERVCVCGTPMKNHPPREGGLLGSCWLSGAQAERTAKAWNAIHIEEQLTILVEGGHAWHGGDLNDQ